MTVNDKLPATILVTVILQSAIAIWWAAGLTTKVDVQGESIKELKLNVAALTAAKVVVLEAEVVRLQSEVTTLRSRGNEQVRRSGP